MKRITLGDDHVGEGILKKYYLGKNGVYQVANTTSLMNSSEARFMAALYEKSTGKTDTVSMPFLCHLGDERIYTREEFSKLEGEAQSKPKCTVKLTPGGKDFRVRPYNPHKTVNS